MPEHKPSREERLAAKLRENLRLRKAQTRALDPCPTDPAHRALPNGEDGG